ncbi:MAG: DUF5655 domain-containing protein [Candidatus Dormibacteria bacterium]
MEQNLEVLLGVRMVATEFNTGDKHGGRIDTLGLDEEGNPVIIEYKWDKSDSVMNQGLFYLDWLIDHRGDFELAVQKALGGSPPISWQQPRVIIVAANYTKYDTFAVHHFPVNIELLRYQRYENGVLVLESISGAEVGPQKKKQPPPAVSGENHAYDLSWHLAKTSAPAQKAFLELRDRILALDGVEERANQKSQITYRTTKSFTACDFRKSNVQVQFKGGANLMNPEGRAKDIRSRAWGYPWVCFLNGPEDVEPVMRFVRSAYELEK